MFRRSLLRGQHESLDAPRFARRWFRRHHKIVAVRIGAIVQHFVEQRFLFFNHLPAPKRSVHCVVERCGTVWCRLWQCLALFTHRAHSGICGHVGHAESVSLREPHFDESNARPRHQRAAFGNHDSFDQIAAHWRFMFVWNDCTDGQRHFEWKPTKTNYRFPPTCDATGQWFVQTRTAFKRRCHGAAVGIQRCGHRRRQ